MNLSTCKRNWNDLILFEIFQKDFFRGKIASVLKGPFLTALIIKNGTNFRARLLTKLLFEL